MFWMDWNDKPGSARLMHFWSRIATPDSGLLMDRLPACIWLIMYLPHRLWVMWSFPVIRIQSFHNMALTPFSTETKTETGAGQQMTLHASIKARCCPSHVALWSSQHGCQVASTETGIIFGYVTFEKKSAATRLQFWETLTHLPKHQTRRNRREAAEVWVTQENA